MSNWTLRVTSGTGRLTRHRGRILYVERRDPALAELAGPTLDISARELAGYAMTNEACPPFVFIDLDNATLLAHGEPGLDDLTGNGAPLPASGLGFVEEHLTPASVFGCRHTPESDDTSLDEGTVPAGGFLLLGPESMPGSDPGDETSATGSVADDDTGQPDTTDHGDGGDPGPETAVPTPTLSLPDDAAEDWDPWHRDPGINLARIGAPTPAEPPSSVPQAASLTPASRQPRPPAEPDGQRDSIPPPPSPPVQATAPPDHLDDRTETVDIVQPLPVQRHQATYSLDAGVDATTLPPIPGMTPMPPPPSTTTEAGVKLTFDDGQVHPIQVGAIIGRNPTKEQVPAGFTAITVRSEHVSRRHWRIDIIDGRPTISDLGSQSGTTIETVDGAQPVPIDGLVVEGEQRVVFADRWATIERL